MIKYITISLVGIILSCLFFINSLHSDLIEARESVSSSDTRYEQCVTDNNQLVEEIDKLRWTVNSLLINGTSVAEEFGGIMSDWSNLKEKENEVKEEEVSETSVPRSNPVLAPIDLSEHFRVLEYAACKATPSSSCGN